jgi:hypothetical protein
MRRQEGRGRAPLKYLSSGRRINFHVTSTLAYQPKIRAFTTPTRFGSLLKHSK